MSRSKEMALKKEVTPFEKNDLKLSIRQLINTLLPLFLLWAAAYYSLSISYWLTFPIALVASGFVLRTFIIFHDCCHGSFFKSKRANDILGTITGVLTLTPYQQWKAEHSIHHATSGNLDKRGVGDIWVMTVDEYKSATPWMRLFYRIYRNPVIMFGIGPIYVFLIAYRFNRKAARRKERLNTHLTTVLIIALYSLMCWLIGWLLQWISGNIGFHHVHHSSPRVPNYYLEEAHNATPPLQKATTITLRSSLVALRFRLWDEQNKQFISFRELKQSSRKNYVPNPIRVTNQASLTEKP